MITQSNQPPAIIPEQMAAMDKAIAHYQDMAFQLSEKVSRIYAKPADAPKPNLETMTPNHLVDAIAQNLEKIRATNNRFEHVLSILNDAI